MTGRLYSSGDTPKWGYCSASWRGSGGAINKGVILTRGFVTMAFLAATALCAPAFAATVINPKFTSPTNLGSYAAGKYRITATGLIDLIWSPGSGFTLRPDGVPDAAVTDGRYLYFNPGGTDFAGGRFGQAGAGFNIGSLVGSFVANPNAGDYIRVVLGTVVTLAAPGSLFAVVNDTFHSNNGGAFKFEVSAVPEPGSWTLMVVGFGLAGVMLRRRRELAVSA